MPKIKSHKNLFLKLPSAKTREVFQTLAKGKGFKIERIVSLGQATPEGKWLRSHKAEWVLVLCGRARLLFKGVSSALDLREGDHVLIPAKTYHRVQWTHPKKRTVWLALHLA